LRSRSTIQHGLRYSSSRLSNFEIHGKRRQFSFSRTKIGGSQLGLHRYDQFVQLRTSAHLPTLITSLFARFKSDTLPLIFSYLDVELGLAVVVPPTDFFTYCSTHFNVSGTVCCYCTYLYKIRTKSNKVLFNLDCILVNEILAVIVPECYSDVNRSLIIYNSKMFESLEYF